MDIVQPGIPTGAILPYAGAAAPSGFLLCSGGVVSRTAYAALFAALGTAYGPGDGSTSFGLPDCRGIFLRGAGTNANISDALGNPYTATRGVSQGDAMQGHVHNQMYTYAAGGSRNLGSAGVDASNTYTTGIGTQGPIGDGSNGSARVGTETRPANIAVNYIIKI
jgi:microcystin-dependent protein